MQISSPLFQALSTIPFLSQVSYIELNGLFFAYYKEDNELYALYSNSTNNQTWYKQSVNKNTGNLHGKAMKFPSSASWFQQALKTRKGHASVGTGWGPSQGTVLLSSAGLDGKRVISLGFSMAPLLHLMVDDLAFSNGSLFLATMDGNVLVQGVPNARMIFDGVDQVTFRLLDDDHLVGNVTCKSDQEGKMRDNVLSFLGRKYVIICSLIEIAGMQFVSIIHCTFMEIISFFALLFKCVQF